MSAKLHGERKHAKLSASGSERWHACPASVHLSEGLPDRSTAASLYGTQAHEVLEGLVVEARSAGHELSPAVARLFAPRDTPREMLADTLDVANFLIRKWKERPGSLLMAEDRVHLDFIDDEIFGTFDGAIVDHYGTLHVFDFKYGTHLVSPEKNLQMIFYGMGLAHLFDWDFVSVRLWIIQPRARGYNGPTFWEISIDELKNYVDVFRKAVKRVYKEPNRFQEGEWCFFCKAKKICPQKREARARAAKDIFKNTPINLK